MLRLLVMQNNFGLFDEDLEDSVYEIQFTRHFVGIHLGRDAVPDSTRVHKFRHLLEENNLTRAISDDVKAAFAEHRFTLKTGTIVDGTLIAAPAPPRTPKASTPLKCAKPRKASSGISA